MQEFPAPVRHRSGMGHPIRIHSRGDRRIPLGGLLFLILTLSVLARPAHVTAVHDGDTVTVTLANSTAPVKVRLNGIDAPELAQPHGEDAQRFLAGLVLNKDVDLQAHGHDRYRRTIGVVTVNGKNVNQAMVQAGWAWWYRKYAPTDHQLEQLEQGAKAAHRGLWADLTPLAPWEFRHPTAHR